MTTMIEPARTDIEFTWHTLDTNDYSSITGTTSTVRIHRGLRIPELLEFADLLDNFDVERKKLIVRVNKFNLSEWLSYRNGLSGHTYSVDKFQQIVASTPNCKTAACAIGFGLLHPYFTPLQCDTPDQLIRFLFGDRSNEMLENYLFQARAYRQTHRGPKDVARRIRKVVALHQKLYG